MEKLVHNFSSYDNIIWDWNGTLLDDVDVSYNIVMDQMKKCNVPLLSQNELKDLFCFPIKKYYKDMGFDVTDTSFEKLAHDYMTSYKEKIDSVKLFKGVKKTLELLATKKQFVVSAAEENYLKNLVTHFGLESHFIKLCGLRDSYGTSKTARCHELIKEYNLEPSKTVFVGDTSHDAEVAKECGLDVLLIADGFQNYHYLKTLGVKVIESRYLI